MSRSLLAFRTTICCPYGVSRSLHVSHLGFGIGDCRIHEHGNQASIGNHLPQQFQSFRLQRTGKKAHARDVSAWPIEASDETAVDRVAADCEDDRNRCGCRLGGEGGRNGTCNDHRHLTSD